MRGARLASSITLRAAPLAFAAFAPVAVVVAGCGRSSASSPSADAAPLAAIDASSASTESIAKPAGHVDLARVYRGTLDAKHVIVMRVTHAGDVVSGTYFYEPSASDLHLKGAIAPSAAIHLDESNGKITTGAFDGAIDASGAFSGTWSDPKHTRSLPFHLKPVSAAPGAAVVLVPRGVTSSLKPKQKVPVDSWPFGEPACKTDVHFFEAIAGIDPKAEATVNKLLREDETAPGACDAPLDHEVTMKIRTNARGVLSVTGSSSHYESGMPHPAYGRMFVNVAVPSGAEIKLADVLTVAAEDVIMKRLAADLAKLDDDTRPLVKDALALKQVDFWLDATGIHLSTFNQLPHAYKGLDGEDGFFIPASALAGARVKPSPVDQLWP